MTREMPANEQNVTPLQFRNNQCLMRGQAFHVLGQGIQQLLG